MRQVMKPVANAPIAGSDRRTIPRSLDESEVWVKHAHRGIARRTPAQAYQARPKATPAKPSIPVHYRARRDKVDHGRVMTLRYNSRLRHVDLGRERRGKRVLALVADLDVRVVDADTGELLRELTLDPSRDYQPLHGPPGPRPRRP